MSKYLFVRLSIKLIFDVNNKTVRPYPDRLKFGNETGPHLVAQFPGIGRGIAPGGQPTLVAELIHAHDPEGRLLIACEVGTFPGAVASYFSDLS